MNVPVILIPGIQGTKLVNTNTLDFDTIWSAVQSQYETINDLALKKDIRFDAMPGSIIDRGDVEDLAYRELVNVLKHKTKLPVYIFGYDWRKSAAQTAKRLAGYVDYLKEKLGVTKFNFVTHSLGGMVFSCYLKSLQGNYDSIDHAVWAACPFAGTVRSLISLTKGEGSFRIPLFHSSDAFRKIARTFPSVYELCPVYKNAVMFENGTEADLSEPDHWQSNICDEDKDLFLERLRQMKAFRDKQDPAMLNLSNAPDPVRRKFLIISGEGEPTKQNVVIQPTSPDGRAKNFFNFDAFGSVGDGDGAVPLESSAIYKDEVLTLAVKSRFFDLAMHALFLNDGRIQTLITRFLLDKTDQNPADPPWWSVLDGSVRQVK